MILELILVMSLFKPEVQVVVKPQQISCSINITRIPESLEEMIQKELKYYRMQRVIEISA